MNGLYLHTKNFSVALGASYANYMQYYTALHSPENVANTSRK